MTTSSPPRVLMLSRYDLEHFTPPQNSILVSISDTPDDLALVRSEQWQNVHYHTFIDSGYDEESVENFGRDFDHIFADYITPDKASALIHDLELIVEAQPSLIVVESDGGNGRRLAVSRFLLSRFGCEFDQTDGEANITVLRLLNRDPVLLEAIVSARSGESEAQKELSPTPSEQGFLSKFLGLIGIEQNPR